MNEFQLETPAGPDSGEAFRSVIDFFISVTLQILQFMIDVHFQLW